ncbi:MAG TPA: LysM peptidoglycan-binding domain-containing protein [Streptosporangiaceae bacterium]|nr:LysM peptidoglycan-binding domain-containing protein [Streptosporangiaceae bacterium]
MEKVAQTAGKAAPAVVVVGTLATTAPHIGGVTAAQPASTVPHVIHAHLDDAAPAATTETVSAHHADAARRSYAVQTGDTLSAITQRFYGKDANWRSLYAANESKISNPNLIYTGEELRLPRHLPAPAAVPAQSSASSTSYSPRHASSGSSGGASGTGSQAAVGTAATTTNLSGTLSCSGLEALWVEAGGSAAVEVTAASIAMAESGGNQFATGTVGERGYWQINPVNGSLSTYDPYGNARAAVIMSGNGANWSPWTTYTSGAYAGRC